MEIHEGDVASGRVINGILVGLFVTAFARASLIVVACAMAGVLSDRGVVPHLAAAGWCFAFMGSFMVGHGLRAERSGMLPEAADHYAFAFSSCVIAAAAFFTAGLAAPATV
jgi:membrane associated rhomboid family serine protease